MRSSDPSKSQWLKENLGDKKSNVGVDLNLLSSTEYLSMSAALESKQINIVGIETNLVDEVWNTQPKAEFKPIEVHELKYSGLQSSEKIQKLKETLDEKNVKIMIITSAADIACK